MFDINFSLRFSKFRSENWKAGRILLQIVFMMLKYALQPAKTKLMSRTLFADLCTRALRKAPRFPDFSLKGGGAFLNRGAFLISDPRIPQFFSRLWRDLHHQICVSDWYKRRRRKFWWFMMSKLHFCFGFCSRNTQNHRKTRKSSKIFASGGMSEIRKPPPLFQIFP